MEKNYYQILGVHPKSSLEEIRRAYRILARRYHPDVNPGRDSGERFKEIASAYDTLSDTEKRNKYDQQRTFEQRREDINRHFRAYQENQHRDRNTRSSVDPDPSPLQAQPDISKESIQRIVSSSVSRLKEIFSSTKEKFASPNSSRRESRRAVSVIEVSVTVKEAVLGIKKTISVSGTEPARRISVHIPPGVRTGSVVRMQSRSGDGEEIVLIVKVLPHPYLSLESKGLIAEIPITVIEALAGATITVPGLDTTLSVKVPPGTQSGRELRLAGKGIERRDGSRGDLFFRFLIKNPDSNEESIQRAAELASSYHGPVRKFSESSLLDS